MKPFIAMTVAVLTLSATNTVTAQFPFSSGYSSSHRVHSRNVHSHGFHSQPARHQCDVARLSNMIGELEEVCTHLHEDTHQLSQDYANSAALEAYVSRLERLKQHTHQMVLEAASSGAYSSHTEQFVKRDMADVRSLLEQFYGLVSGQACIGARDHDLHLLEHMQEVIVHEAFPLLVRIEVELYGRAQGRSCPIALAHAGHHGASSNLYSSSRYGYGQPESRVHVETRTTYRPTPPAIPAFAARMMSQRGIPLPPGISRSRATSHTGIRVGNLRISF